MTVDTKSPTNVCPKCGSIMHLRRIKLSSGQVHLILQCQACRYYIEQE